MLMLVKGKTYFSPPITYEDLFLVQQCGIPVMDTPTETGSLLCNMVGFSHEVQNCKRPQGLTACVMDWDTLTYCTNPPFFKYIYTMFNSDVSLHEAQTLLNYWS